MDVACQRVSNVKVEQTCEFLSLKKRWPFDVVVLLAVNNNKIKSLNLWL